jgi:EAL domain-containing protein (putative c-di-GMP-specific phosphodiesterase class I)
MAVVFVSWVDALNGGTMELSKFRLQQHLSAQHYVGRGSANTSIGTTVELIAEHFSAPMVQVNVVTAEDQVTIAAIGGPVGVRPRVDSFCTNVVSQGRVTFLSDIPDVPARLEHIKAYLGVPLTGREGLVIGALCLLDTTERDFAPGEVEKLQRMAEVVQDQLELMRRLGAVPYGPTGKAAELNSAVQDGQIVPFYQPIVDLATGEIRAVEALARWQHPTRGLLAPEEFIPLAEDSDIIIDLDLSVLRQAAIQLGRWRLRHPKLRLSVNLSARHFDHAECVRRLRDTVEMVGNDPASVTLELTETARLASNPGDQEHLRALRKLGFQVVLDDFGSGFASMEQILRLPVDGIKLDRTLTTALGTRCGDAVVRHLVELARDLRLTTVVEGIEHDRQADRVRRDGGTFGQGHLWSAAIPVAAMTALLDRHRPTLPVAVDPLTDLLVRRS